MRRSVVLLSRGGQTHGWYRKYLEQGPQGFKKSKPPTVFNWNEEISPVTKKPIERPHVHLTIRIDKDIVGKLIIELAKDIVPKTVDNFIRLCCNQGPKEFNNGGYKGSNIHLIRKGEVLMAGDIEKLNGKGNHSSYEHQRFIADENFIIPHSQRGLVSMVSYGINTGGSQFYVDLAPSSHLNGRCVVFGRIVEGEEILQMIEKQFCIRCCPIRDVTIIDCGLIDYNKKAKNPNADNDNSDKSSIKKEKKVNNNSSSLIQAQMNQ